MHIRKQPDLFGKSVQQSCYSFQQMVLYITRHISVQEQYRMKLQLKNPFWEVKRLRKFLIVLHIRLRKVASLPFYSLREL